MSFKLQFVFIVASVITFLFVILRIRKHGLNIDDALGWLLWIVLLVILSLFPQIASFISDRLGFMSASNMIFTAFILFLYIMLFIQTIQISKLKERQKELIQKLSLKDYVEKQEKNKT